MNNSLPNKEEIHRLLDEGYALNRGPWTKHALNAGRAARIIAEACGLDSDRAYAFGALHDIGRREGITHLHHVLAGYRFMVDRGYPDVARICLTHSFPLPTVECYFGKRDCAPDEIAFLDDFLSTVRFDDYDRLIQLCDCLADASGFCPVEKRLIDVISRYGTNDLTGEKINAHLANRDYFTEKAGRSLYTLLPGIEMNALSY